MAIGCVLVVGGVMVAMWQFDVRSSNRHIEDDTNSSKNRKGGKTR